MKKHIYTLYFVCLLGSSLHAQILWSDDFDNYTLGNLGVINIYNNPNNSFFSQGNWLLSEVPHTNSTAPQYLVTIEAETGRGKVLKMQDIPISNTPLSMHAPNLYAVKKIPNLDTLWNNRTTGNDILKYECEFYLAFEESFPAPPIFEIGLSRIESNETVKVKSTTLAFDYSGSTKEIRGKAAGTGPPALPNIPLSPWTWTKIIIYVDYTTGFVYFEVPPVNTAYRSNNPLPPYNLKVFNLLHLTFVSDVASGGGNRFPNLVKFDNFKVSAVNTLPLSLKKLAAATFSIFPNPVTDVVTITNSENIGVEQIEIFDISGKKVQSQNFNNENEVQLNLGDFASGTYLLHIKTNAGTAIEKVVKK